MSDVPDDESIPTTKEVQAIADQAAAKASAATANSVGKQIIANLEQRDQQKVNADSAAKMRTKVAAGLSQDPILALEENQSRRDLLATEVIKSVYDSVNAEFQASPGMTQAEADKLIAQRLDEKTREKVVAEGKYREQGPPDAQEAEERLKAMSEAGEGGGGQARASGSGDTHASGLPDEPVYGMFEEDERHKHQFAKGDNEFADMATKEGTKFLDEQSAKQ